MQEIANNFKFKISIPISIQFIIYLVRQSVNHATKYKYKKSNVNGFLNFPKLYFPIMTVANLFYNSLSFVNP